MKRVKEIFIDSDVLISSLLSSSGAAAYLLKNAHLLQHCAWYTSKYIQNEVVHFPFSRKIDFAKFFKASTLVKLSKKDLEKSRQYVNDEFDAHVIAGAVKSQAHFLITYNTKDFKVDLIKRECSIVVLSPGYFLQHLRLKENV